MVLRWSGARQKHLLLLGSVEIKVAKGLFVAAVTFYIRTY